MKLNSAYCTYENEVDVLEKLSKRRRKPVLFKIILQLIDGMDIRGQPQDIRAMLILEWSRPDRSNRHTEKTNACHTSLNKYMGLLHF